MFLEVLDYDLVGLALQGDGTPAPLELQTGVLLKAKVRRRAETKEDGTDGEPMDLPPIDFASVDPALAAQLMAAYVALETLVRRAATAAYKNHQTKPEALDEKINTAARIVAAAETARAELAAIETQLAAKRAELAAPAEAA